MHIKIITAIIIALLVNLAFVPSTFASGNPEKEVKFAEKVKTEIAKLGVGKDARIKVKLKDGTKLKGYVSEINDNEFTVTDAKSGVTKVVPYSSAKQVKGNNLSSGIIIGIGVVAFVIILAFIFGGS